MKPAGSHGRGLLSWIVAASVGVGCAAGGAPAPKAAAPAAATPPPKPVVVGKRLPHAGCRKLTPIKGVAGSGGWGAAGADDQDAHARLKRATLVAGGDYALIESVSKDATGATTMTGHAYDCSGQAPAQAAGGGAGPAWPPEGGAAAQPQGKSVQIGRILPHDGCRALGQIMGSGGGGAWTSTESKMMKAYDQMTTMTQSMGGDYALIDVAASDVRGITITGQAYDCSRPPAKGASNQPAPAAPPAPSIEDRLRRLDQLKEQGLITPEEHATRRRAILNEL